MPVTLRIVVDRDLCEANAICVGWAPEVFGLDEANGMVVLDATPGPDLREKLKCAVDRCPRGAIALVEEG